MNFDPRARRRRRAELAKLYKSMTTDQSLEPEERKMAHEVLTALNGDDDAALIEAHLNFVHGAFKYESLLAEQEAKLLKLIDPDFFDNSATGDFFSVREIFERKIADSKSEGVTRERFEEWLKGLSVEVQRLRRRYRSLKVWQVPDYPGALLQLVRDVFHMHKDEIEDLLPPEILALAEHVRRGNVDLSVAERHALLSMHFPLRYEEYPELLSEREAAEFVSRLIGSSISGSTIASRADTHKYLKDPVTGKYYRDKLREAAKMNLFEPLPRGASARRQSADPGSAD